MEISSHSTVNPTALLLVGFGRELSISCPCECWWCRASTSSSTIMKCCSSRAGAFPYHGSDSNSDDNKDGEIVNGEITYFETGASEIQIQFRIRVSMESSLTQKTGYIYFKIAISVGCPLTNSSRWLACQNHNDEHWGSNPTGIFFFALLVDTHRKRLWLKFWKAFRNLNHNLLVRPLY